MLLDPVRQMTDRRHDAVGLRARPLDGIRAELAGAHEDGLHADALRPDYVALHVAAHHPRNVRIRVERLAWGGKVRRARLPEHDRLDARRVLETCDERSGVELRPVICLPPP